ncbi:helix-turn-helix domain-containing protein [Herbaspirillum sp. GCM10030257]|uniref:helix-turn-helix domain-containing protein n=1 Tax=Herbaspirillum sp. GCM10030257 TaxID=3273393 RepID=UPI00361FAA2D
MTRNIPDAVRYANQLLDKIMHDMGLTTDAALCRVLSISPPVLSKVRHGRVPFGAALIISVHEETGISIKELKYMLEYGVATARSLQLNTLQHSKPAIASFV